MTTTYVTSRTILHPALLVNYLSNKTSITVDSFNVESGALTLSLPSLDATTKTLLDSLVSSFIDSSALTLADELAYRYARFYKSSDQSITATIGSITPVTFLSANFFDCNYYDFPNNGAYVIVKKPGMYVFYAKVGAHLTGTTTTTTSLKWSFQFDATQTGTVWMNISDCVCYTYHTGSTSMYDTSVLCCSYNVTNGGFVRLICSPVTGGASLSVTGDCTSSKFLSISGLAVYDGILTSTVSQSTTWANVPFNYDRTAQVPLSHSPGSASVTVNAPGTVYVVSRSTFQKTTGTDTSIGSSAILHNGTIPGSNLIAYGAALYTTGDKMTCVNDGTIDVVAGDVISVQSSISAGSGLSLSANESSLLIFYLTSVNNENNLFTGDIEINALPTISMSVTDAASTNVQFQVQSESFPNYSLGVTFSSTTPQLTCNTTGIYFVTADISMYNPNGVQRTVSAGLSVSVDGGTTYLYQAGSTNTKQLSNVAGSYTTLSVSHLVHLTIGNRMLFQVSSLDATSADAIQVGNYTNLTAQCFQGNTNTFFAVDPSLFGQNPIFVKSFDILTVNGTAWHEKCRLVTNYVDAGTYRIQLVAMLTYSGTTDPCSMQIIDYCSGGSSSQSEVVLQNNIPQSIPQLSLFQLAYLTAGVHDIVLEFAATANVTLTVSNVTMEFYRFA